MADNVQFLTGLLSALPSAISDGAILIAQGDKNNSANYHYGKIYFDTGANRYLLTDSISEISKSTSTEEQTMTLNTEQGMSHVFSVTAASTTAPGLVSTTTQSLAGPKTFTDSITISNSTNTLNAKLIVEGKAIIGKLNISNSNGISYGTEDPPTTNVAEGDVYFKLI